ncbi:Phage gp6-like head-tail connector protein [Roseovarius pacificus]|uniref:Phage gp6-like head-tail connector protein n=1 Tax=Roseovarius pacificus TaxID=337701 RepID=A0A1M7BJX1_9RHOB|nr:head-tail connector protein [Roseovarius pacificus]GGO55222.1 hypothetical protein GCM10011315_17250 [Roseovarius pacificus]SHL55335.1 Phage gp6-like head-tail connector protein [Roseovarius pacificus]
MAIVSLHELEEQLSLTSDVGGEDSLLLSRKIDAAQNHIERLLGFRIEATFGGEGQDPVPPVLVEAVLQLAAWWYEQRETAIVGNAVNDVPFGVSEIVNEYREWAF